MNSILLGILRHKQITRTPRSFEKRAFWKALKFRTLLLFNGYVVLKPVLPPQYLQHFEMLAYGTYLLLKSQVSFQGICEVRAQLSKFVMKMAKLYSIQHLSYNVHQLFYMSDAAMHGDPCWQLLAFRLREEMQCLPTTLQAHSG